VELDAFGGLLGVTQAHGHAARAAGGDHERRGQGRFVDDQRVVAGGPEARGQPGQQAAAVMSDGGRLAVHGLRGNDDLGAVGGGNGLVAEADAEQRDGGGAVPDGCDADTGFGGSAWTG
jgi:hypothetical protein